jgi:large subunit ribosomal protein L2
MGKRIVSRARGHGSRVYQVRRKGYMYKPSYPTGEGKAKIIKLIHSPGHSAPLAKLQMETPKKEIFYNQAHKNAYEGQVISVGKSEKISDGDIIRLKDLSVGNRIFNIELSPGGSGKLIKTAGGFAEVLRADGNKTFILMPSKKTIEVNSDCRVTVGIIAGSGRKEKPWVKAGRKFHAMKAKGRKWHYTSPIKTNAIDHPFGGGRGKRIKSKIAKRNAPPGAKVGHLRPRRTGHRK